MTVTKNVQSIILDICSIILYLYFFKIYRYLYKKMIYILHVGGGGGENNCRTVDTILSCCKFIIQRLVY